MTSEAVAILRNFSVWCLQSAEQLCPRPEALLPRGPRPAGGGSALPTERKAWPAQLRVPIELISVCIRAETEEQRRPWSAGTTLSLGTPGTAQNPTDAGPPELRTEHGGSQATKTAPGDLSARFPHSDLEEGLSTKPREPRLQTQTPLSLPLRES